jgi:hypothetical protein
MTNTVDKSPAEIKQQLFDKMAAHLLQQGSRALTIDCNGAQKCVYRGDGGKMCAVGCLISDEAYTQSFEGTGIVGNPPLQDAVERSQGYSTEFWAYSEAAALSKMLSAVQRIHDTVAPVGWKSELRHLAKKLDLQWNHEAAPPAA